MRRGKELIADEHGDDLPDVETAYLNAFAAARELWTMTLARRDDPTAYSFEVMDDAGRFLFTLPLSEVLDATRTGRKRLGRSDIQALLNKNRALRDSLVEQIAKTRSNLDRTHDLLRALREYD
jgi:hypothetical protein